jgi:hypothetical protein
MAKHQRFFRHGLQHWTGGEGVTKFVVWMSCINFPIWVGFVSMGMSMIVEGWGQKIEFGQKRDLGFLLLVAKTEEGQAGFSAQMAQTFIKCHINFKPNTFKLYKASAELMLRTGYEKLLQNLCKLQIKRLGSMISVAKSFVRSGKQETRIFLSLTRICKFVFCINSTGKLNWQHYIGVKRKMADLFIRTD